MFKNLTENEKLERYNELIAYAQKIKNTALRNTCIKILKDYKEELFCRSAGHDGIEMKKYNRTHQCFDGGLLDHLLNVTKNAYAIANNYRETVDMDLVIFGSILHDIGKTKIFDKWNEESEIKANLNYSYLLVDHVYIGMNIVDSYLTKENITEKFKYQALHMIATHMDTMDKHMAEAYIVSYADSLDADIENIISYPRNSVNPIYNKYYYESDNENK